MKKKLTLLIVLLALAIVSAVLVSLYSYNDIISARNTVEEKMKGYKGEYDKKVEYAFNLVGSIYFQIEPEQEAIQKMVSARAEWEKAGEGKNFEDQLKALKNSEEILQEGFGRILSVAESKKETLEKNQEYQGLRAEGDVLEDAMGKTRSELNRAIERYNDKIRSFPGKFLADFYRFTPFPLDE